MAERILQEILVLADKDNHQEAVSLLPGEIVQVLGPAEDDRFVRIQVGCKVFEAFASDVKDRCESFQPQGRTATP